MIKYSLRIERVYGRLVRWDLNDVTQENYSYDAAGNLLTKGSLTYTYNNANQITNQGFTYDNNGNLTCDGTYKYAYDSENHLVEVRKFSDNSLVATYSYNHDGLRKSKTVYTGSNPVTTNFYWDALGRLVKGDRSYIYDNSGNLVAILTSEYYKVNTNLRGDVVSITNENGGLVASYKYDPWGKIISSTGTFSQSFRYAGYYYDSETGLYYCKSRYYSPKLGRFLTKDSIDYINYSDPQTLNLYNYCRNNPVNSTDPSGHSDLAGFELDYDLEADNYWNKNVVEPAALTIAVLCFSRGASAPVARQKFTEIAGEVGSISIRATRHGAIRLAERGFTAEEYLLTKSSTNIMTQSDGAKVFVHELNKGRFNVIVEGESGVVTAFKNISKKSLDKLSKNYGWK